MTDPAARARTERRLLQEVTDEVTALEGLKLGALQRRYRELFGQAADSKNVQWLRRKLAWRIQELAEGGLSPRALQRIHELAPAELPPPGPKRPGGRRPGPAPAPIEAPPPTPSSTPTRDPRLPEAGAVLRRSFQGTDHEVTVLEAGFMWNGAFHRSLSGIARTITGTAWNGFAFFGVGGRR